MFGFDPFLLLVFESRGAPPFASEWTPPVWFPLRSSLYLLYWEIESFKLWPRRDCWALMTYVSKLMITYYWRRTLSYSRSSLNQAWSSALLADILSSGWCFKSFCTKSMTSAVYISFGSKLIMPVPGDSGNLSSIWLDCFLYFSMRSLGVEPQTLCILMTWSYSSFPAKSG